MAVTRTSKKKKKAAPARAVAGAARPARGPMPTADKFVHLIFVRTDVTDVKKAFDKDDELTDAAHKDVMKEARKSLPLLSNPAMTDVVVFAGRPWHFAKSKLHKHPHVHGAFKGTVLVVSRQKAERAVWWSETDFHVTGVANQRADGVQDPFPLPETTQETDGSGQTIYVARATVHRPDVDRNRFKITFTMNAEKIDPDMDCQP